MRPSAPFRSVPVVLRRVGVGALATGAGAALMLGTGVLSADAAAPTARVHHATHVAACGFGQHLRAAWGRVPAELKTELQAARKEPKGSARRAAIEAVEQKALAGDFGAAAEVRIEWMQQREGRLRPLPANLKSDLQKLKGETRSERIAGLDAIANNAVAGDYGTTIEDFAKLVQSSSAWKTCTAASTSSGSSSTSGTSTSGSSTSGS